MEHAGQAVTHVPLGTPSAPTELRLDDGAVVSGAPPVDRVVLATGYVVVYFWPDEQALGMAFRGKRWVTPLYELAHARRSPARLHRPLAVPCPIPFFEPPGGLPRRVEPIRPGEELTVRGRARRLGRCTPRAERIRPRRPQDTHLTGAAGGSAWTYMRELLGIRECDAAREADGRRRELATGALRFGRRGSKPSRASAPTAARGTRFAVDDDAVPPLRIRRRTGRRAIRGRVDDSRACGRAPEPDFRRRRVSSWNPRQ